MKIHQRGEFTAEKYAEQVVIHAVFDGKKLVQSDGRPLPRMAEGARVQIRVPAVYLQLSEDENHLKQEEMREFLPHGSIVFAAVDLRGIKDRIYKHQPIDQELGYLLDLAEDVRRHHDIGDMQQLQPYEGLIPVRLHEPLTIIRRGLKSYRFMPCKCEILHYPHEHAEVNSLNQVLTKISERMEIHRASHTGNAFVRCLAPVRPGLRGEYVPAEDGPLVRLETLRDRVTWTHEAQDQEKKELF